MTTVNEWLKYCATAETDDCLEWPFYRDPCGYGRMREREGYVLPHRYICAQVHGKPTKRKPNSLHSCGNPACTNPRHLRWGTQRENRADMVKDGTLPVGERNGACKLTEAQVRQIRDMIAAGYTQRAVAAKVGCGVATVSTIANRQYWKHVA